MNTRYNINVVMCEHADENVTHINNIFNAIKMEDDGSASFDIITFVNCLGQPGDFSLAYFLQHRTRENGGPITFLSATEYSYDGERETFQSVQNIDRTHIPNVNLDGEGHYVLLAYMYDDDTLKKNNIDFKEDFEGWIQRLDDENIVSMYEFDVRG